MGSMVRLGRKTLEKTVGLKIEINDGEDGEDQPRTHQHPGKLYDIHRTQIKVVLTVQQFNLRNCVGATHCVSKQVSSDCIY